MHLVPYLSAVLLIASCLPSSSAAPNPHEYFKQAQTAHNSPRCQDTVIAHKQESCSRIAQQHHISLGNFKKWNPSIDEDCTNIRSGQVLCVSEPAKTPTFSQKAIKTKDTATSTTATTTTITTSTTTNAPSPISSPSTAPDAPTGLTVALKDSDHFCLFLPTAPGNQDPEAIASSEKSAVSFCTQKKFSGSPSNVGVLPAGFIQSALFQEDTQNGFVQVTGTINRDAYGLSPTDGGGQYDNHGAGSPPQSSCKGYPYYVELIEPDINGFCIRCCKSYTDCNAGRSQYGCQRVAPPLNATSIPTTTNSPTDVKDTNVSKNSPAAKKGSSQPNTPADKSFFDKFFGGDDDW